MKLATQKAIYKWYQENKQNYAFILNKDYSQPEQEGEAAEAAAFIIAEYQRTFTDLGRYPKALMKELGDAHDFIHQCREYFEKVRKNALNVYINRRVPVPAELEDIFLGILATYVAYLHAEKLQPNLGQKTIKEWYASQTY